MTLGGSLGFISMAYTLLPMACWCVLGGVFVLYARPDGPTPASLSTVPMGDIRYIVIVRKIFVAGQVGLSGGDWTY